MKKTLLFTIILAFLAVGVWGQGTTFEWIGPTGTTPYQGGDWNVSTNWSPTGYPGDPDRPGSEGDIAILRGGQSTAAPAPGTIMIINLNEDIVLEEFRIIYDSRIRLAGTGSIKTETTELLGVLHLFDPIPATPLPNDITFTSHNLEIGPHSTAGTGHYPGFEGSIKMGRDGGASVTTNRAAGAGTASLTVTVGTDETAVIGNITSGGTRNVNVVAGAGSTVIIDNIEQGGGGYTETGGGTVVVASDSEYTFTWTGGDGDGEWTTPGNWIYTETPILPEADAYPGGNSRTSDIAIIPSGGTVALTGSALAIASLENHGELTLNANLTAGKIENTGTLTLGANLSSGPITNNGILDLGSQTLTVGTITNGGTLKLQGDDGQLAGGTHTTMGGTVVFNTGGTTFSGISNFTDLEIAGGNRDVTSAAITVGGDFTLSGGSIDSIASLTVTGTSNISANITTTGDQTYKGEVTLGADVTLAGSTITFENTVNGTSNLTITGDAVFENNVGSTTALASLSVSGTSTITTTGTNARTITTTGEQTYTGAVTLGADVTFSGDADELIYFKDAVSGTGEDRNLTITTADVQFDGIVGTNIGNITLGTAAVPIEIKINEDITTTGTQTYNGDVTLGGTGTRTLESTEGSVTATGVVDGTDLTVNALQGISLKPTDESKANALTGTVTLNNSQATGTVTGNIEFTNDSTSVTLSAINASTATGSGNITINQTGDLIIGTPGITAANGVVSLTASGDITINYPINCYRLELFAVDEADEPNGTVAINAVVTVSKDDGSSDPDIEDCEDNAAVYIKAGIIEGTESFNIESNECICATISKSIEYIQPVLTGKGIHYHIPEDRHVVYRSGDRDSFNSEVFSPLTLSPLNFLYIQADLNFGSSFGLETSGDGNIYIIDIHSTTHNASTRAVTFSTATGGIIEFRGAYNSTAENALTLNPGTSGVHLNGATASGDVVISLTNTTAPFQIANNNQDMTISGDASITASSIRLGTDAYPTTITGGGTTSSLKLTSKGDTVTGTSSGDIAIIGSVGTETSRLDFVTITLEGNYSEIYLTGTSSFDDGIYTDGYITLEGPVTFDGTVILSTGTVPSSYNDIVVDSDITLKGDAVVSFAGNLTHPSSSVGITIIADDGGTVEFTTVTITGVNGLTLDGGTEAKPLVLRSNDDLDPNPAEIYADVTISSGSYVLLDDDSFFRQENGSPLVSRKLTVEGETSSGDDDAAVFDTSAGSWHIGGTASAGTDFLGLYGELILGGKSKLITNHLNINANNVVSGGVDFSIKNVVTTPANTDDRTIEVKGNVNIGETTSPLFADYQNLIIFMNFNNTQEVTAYQAFPNFHVGEESSTYLTTSLDYDTIYFRGEVRILAKDPTKGYFNARDNNIVIYAGLTGKRDLTNFTNDPTGADTVSVGRWVIDSAVIGSPVMANFVFRQGSGSSVEFREDPDDLSGNDIFFEIMGNTMWQNFICKEAGSVIQFTANGDQHYFLEGFEIAGTGTGSEITVTRMPKNLSSHPDWVYKHKDQVPGTPDAETAGIPLDPPQISSTTEAGKFWNFNRIGTASIKLDHVILFFSHAAPRISTNISTIDNLSVIPYYSSDVTKTSHFNYDWADVSINKIMYSFLEDSNGNGKADRIRVQANVTPINDGSAFTGFVIEVTDADGRIIEYYKDNFEIVYDQTSNPTDQASFYINLNDDNARIYDGRPFTWRIISNTTLIDYDTEKPIGEVGETFRTINTIPPRISYALALPGHNEIYVEFSQPVVLYSIDGTLDVSYNIGGGIISDARIRPVNTAPLPSYFLDYGSNRFRLRTGYNFVPPSSGVRGYIIELDTALTTAQLAGLEPIGTDPSIWFAIDRLRNMAVRALDWSDEKVDSEDFENFQPPRYPIDWKYNGYENYAGNSHAAGPSGDLSDDAAGNPVPDTALFLPPYRVLTPRMIDALKGGGNVTPGNFDDPSLGSPNRRVTDVLVSLEPETAASENYFVWPIYAKTEDDRLEDYPFPTDPDPDFWGNETTDHNIIWNFDGTRMLELIGIDGAPISKFELQARVQTGLGIPTMFYGNGLGIGVEYRNPPAAAQQSSARSGGLWLPDHSAALTHIVPQYYTAKEEIGTAPPLSMFDIDISSDPNFATGAVFEFFFKFASTSDLFVARLEAPQGTIPSNWYQLVRPFRFGITNVIEQGGGVTILNNVINSDNREIAYLRYRLNQPGRVTIQVFTLDGTLVRNIRRGEQREAGVWTDGWDGTNQGGRPVARGMYFIRILAPDIDEIRKVMVVR